ncbi:class I SAM-dependent methyltransferase [Methylocystis sp. H62]|uniref:class I SAM-dependent methyltransferase n=1 Tax=Methylocystis sp. H62 TaxID=2785789 RepID=UPI0018C1D239|nr:class I SAM-dependent methyltransferase [Methylocystis sp. H62]MBG0791971.1 class I SAM-dependent methyltransferase [Methylocystis sp. H62]
MNIGVVNVLTNFMVEGWAIEPDQVTPAPVAIEVDGKQTAVVQPSVFRQDLVDAHIGDGQAGFRFYFPQIASRDKSAVVVVRRVSTGDQLSGPTVVERLAPMYSKPISRIMAQAYSASTIAAAVSTPGVLDVTAAVVIPTNSELSIKPLSASVKRISDVSIGGNALTLAFKEAGLSDNICVPCGVTFKAHFDPTTTERFFAFELVEQNSYLAATTGLGLGPAARFAASPNLDWMTFAKEENSSRTCGPGALSGNLANTGLSTAYQLLSIATEYRNGTIDTILDWGVGYGRVAIPFKRVVAPHARVLGIDVDKFNVDWCREHLRDIEISQCAFFPPTEIASDSVDLVYAISVMNHLTEQNQIKWLIELRRILKPGGIAILSAVTEHALTTHKYLDPVTLRDLYTRGIADAQLDYNLGPHLAIKDYYRATYQLNKHIASVWGEFFEIVEVYPGAVTGLQDAVVMRRNGDT